MILLGVVLLLVGLLTHHEWVSVIGVGLILWAMFELGYA